MSVGSLGRDTPVLLSDPTPESENDSQSRERVKVARLAAEHNQPALCSRSTGRLAACQLAVVVDAHCHESGNDGTAGHQVGEGSAFSVCHWESWCDLPPLLHTIGQRSSLALVFHRDLKLWRCCCLLFYTGFINYLAQTVKNLRGGL